MMKFNDRSHILMDDVKTTPDGYKVVRSKIARTGVQSYYGFEFEGEAAKHGFGDRDLVRVYRSPEEVFHKDAVNGWAGVPVTLDHPDELVTPENVAQHQVGDVRDKAHVDKDGGWFGLEWMIKVSDAIAKFDSGEYREVSGGYTSVIDWTPGVAPDGSPYDAQQTRITPNHVAMVRRGRAFSDSANKWGASPVTLEDNKMTVDLKTVILGDKSVQVEAKDADTVAAILKDHKTVLDAKDTEIGRVTAELAEAKSKIISDADFEAKVAEAVEYRARLEAVKAKWGDEAVKDASPAMIDGMFRVIDKAVDDTVRQVITDKKTEGKPGDWDAFYAKKKGAK